MADLEPAASPEDLPATGYAVLGLLAFDQELSGYDLKKWADWSIGFFYWSPSHSQIYSQLKRLTEHGYVTSRVVDGAGRHDRRLYRMTPAGRDALQQWVNRAPVDRTVLKHSMLMRVWLGHLAEPERLSQMLTDHRARTAETLADAADRERGAARGSWAYPEVALRWARRYHQAELDLTDALLADLAELSALPLDQGGRSDRTTAPRHGDRHPTDRD